MAENRSAPRVASKHQGRAIIGGRSDMECIVRDVSATGARISFSNAAFLPKTFMLRFGGESHKVSVKWQRGLEAGVRFQTPIRSPVQKKRRLLLWA